MDNIWESSIEELYQSAVDAYPETGLRQHATQPVVITKLNWIPYLGMKTLFVKGFVQSEGHEYSTIILFKGVNYNNLSESVKLYASDGVLYKFSKLSLNETQVSVRCNCPDFNYRFAYYNHLDESLYGRKPSKYNRKTDREPVNPKEHPGLCKHLIKMQEVLQKSNIFA